MQTLTPYELENPGKYRIKEEIEELMDEAISLCRTQEILDCTQKLKLKKLLERL